MAEDDARRLAGIEEALRRYYAAEAATVETDGLTARRAMATARRRRRTVWAGIAAALVLVVVGVAVAPRLLPDRPVPATPGPAPSSASATPTPTLTGPARENWFTWRQAPDAPIDASDYRRAAAAHGVYFVGGEVSEVAGKEQCRLLPVRYVDLASDQWSELPIPEVPRGWCAADAVGHQDDLYLLVGKDVEDAVLPGAEVDLPTLQLWSYRAASGAWEQLSSPAAKTGWGNVVGLADGFVRIGVVGDDDGNPLSAEYSWFDYATATWHEGRVSDQSPTVLRAADGFAYQDPIRVDGRSLVLFVDWTVGRPAGGAVTLTTWDPATNQRVRQTSHELSDEVMQNSQGNLEFADPGFVLVGSDSPANPSTKAMLVDLRDGTWSELEVPDRDGPISQRHPGAAAWATAYFPDELAGHLVANGYLFNPVTQRWLWVPEPGASPPDSELESGDASVEIAPSLRCDWGHPPLPCWRLDVDPVESIAGEFSAAEIAENNRR